MMRIPELKTNSYWSTQYAPSMVSNIKSTSPQQNQLDYAFQYLQTFPSFSWQKYQDQQDQYRSSISSFTDSARGLTSSVKSLMSAGSSNQRTVSTSTGAAVTGVAKNGATLAQYNVSVSQVATSQRNEGKMLSPSAYGGVTRGSSTFGIKVGNGVERQVSVNTVATDTNSQVLKKFASAINNSGADVVAEVKTKNNAQYLSITSKNTGAASAFAIRDINGSGVADLQLGNKVVNAADAKYSVNGTNYQTATNKVSLDKGNVSLSINATTTGTIKINVGEDNSKIVAAAKGVVDSYNRLHDVLSNTENNVTKRGERVLNGVDSLIGKIRTADFSAIGISLNKGTGELQVDEKKLSNALASNPDKVKGLLTGSVSLGKTVERASKEIANTPVSSYLKPPNPLDSLHYGSQFSTSGWMSSQNSLTQGLFLNMMV